ncbi:hypothetical protein HMPREF1980_02451 [Actinomyces sp. oral taxon 172 str. F0311]|nr:hypothetical protein HMPREF1980_02451 [Actinomyces sp. oral taxon 172 str. F0311]
MHNNPVSPRAAHWDGSASWSHTLLLVAHVGPSTCRPLTSL